MPVRCRDPPRREAFDEPAFQQVNKRDTIMVESLQSPADSVGLPCSTCVLPSQQIAVSDRWHNRIGMRTQWQVHTLGLWHEAAAVLVFDKSRLLLQQRSARKWTYPNAWDASVAETVETDELPGAAAARGALEELNIALLQSTRKVGAHSGAKEVQFMASKPVCWAGRMPEMDLADCEIVHFYVARDPLDDAESLQVHGDTSGGDDTNGRGEVQALRWVEVEDLGKEIEARPESFTPLLLSAWYECRDCWPNSAEHPLPGVLVSRG